MSIHLLSIIVAPIATYHALPVTVHPNRNVSCVGPLDFLWTESAWPTARTDITATRRDANVWPAESAVPPVAATLALPAKPVGRRTKKASVSRTEAITVMNVSFLVLLLWHVLNILWLCCCCSFQVAWTQMTQKSSIVV